MTGAHQKDQISGLLNEVRVSANVSTKLEKLEIIQELFLHAPVESGEFRLLIDSFLEEVLAFQTDQCVDVRKGVVSFIEVLCQKDPDLLPSVMGSLQLMISDSAVAVRKCVIHAMTHLYSAVLSWLSNAKAAKDGMDSFWKVVSNMKEIIKGLLEADNNGIQMHTVKFMEMLVIVQTLKSSESVHIKPHDFSLDNVPQSLELMPRQVLEEEAVEVFEELLKYHQSDSITSVNLMTCMSALTNIARSRPQQFMSKVITALEMLQAELPRKMGKSQESSLRKRMKRQLLILLGHPVAIRNHISNITSLLTDLSAVSSEKDVKNVISLLETLHERFASILSAHPSHAHLVRPAMLPLLCYPGAELNLEKEGPELSAVLTIAELISQSTTDIIPVLLPQYPCRDNLDSGALIFLYLLLKGHKEVQDSLPCVYSWKHLAMLIIPRLRLTSTKDGFKRKSLCLMSFLLQRFYPRPADPNFLLEIVGTALKDLITIISFDEQVEARKQALRCVEDLYPVLDLSARKDLLRIVFTSAQHSGLRGWVIYHVKKNALESPWSKEFSGASLVSLLRTFVVIPTSAQDSDLFDYGEEILAALNSLYVLLKPPTREKFGLTDFEAEFRHQYLPRLEKMIDENKKVLDASVKSYPEDHYLYHEIVVNRQKLDLLRCSLALF